MFIFLCLCLRFSMVASYLNVYNMIYDILTIKYIKASMCLYNWGCDLFSHADTSLTTVADLMHTLFSMRCKACLPSFSVNAHTHILSQALLEVETTTYASDAVSQHQPISHSSILRPHPVEIIMQNSTPMLFHPTYPLWAVNQHRD